MEYVQKAKLRKFKLSYKLSQKNYYELYDLCMKSNSIKSFSIFRNKEIEGRIFPGLVPHFNMKTLKLSGKDEY